jgi:hypothetical protein
VPWASVFEDSETDSAQRGIYIVYLFNIKAGTIVLSLNQGTTFVRREFGKAAPEVLPERARAARLRLKEWTLKFPEQLITLGSTPELPLDYEAGHILRTTYRFSNLPSEQALKSTLLTLVEAYRALLFRGPPESPFENGLNG